MLLVEKWANVKCNLARNVSRNKWITYILNMEAKRGHGGCHNNTQTSILITRGLTFPSKQQFGASQKPKIKYNQKSKYLQNGDGSKYYKFKYMDY